MAISVNQNYQRISNGSKWKVVGEATLDSLYVTGGYSINPQKFGLDRIDSFLCTSEEGYIFDYDFSTLKLLVIRTGGSGSWFNSTPANTTQGGERLYYTPTAGTFIVGDVVTNGTGGSATVSAVTTRAGQNCLDVSVTAGSFAAADVITGSLSTATGTLTYETVAVFSVPYPVNSILCCLNGSTHATLTLTALTGTMTSSTVRLQPGPISAITLLPSYWDAEILFSAAPPSLDWCFSSFYPELSTNLTEVEAGTDLSGVTIDFEVTGV